MEDTHLTIRMPPELRAMLNEKMEEVKPYYSQNAFILTSIKEKIERRDVNSEINDNKTLWTAELLVDYQKKEYARHIGTLQEAIKGNWDAIFEGREFPQYFILGVFYSHDEASKRIDLFTEILDKKFSKVKNPL